ncbi:MAG: insulinase family protein [Candidatus Eremiobacteraeota bacterium]|nr:insulinase family protein [Candidatus Eremiobacteraeota bacterium]
MKIKAQNNLRFLKVILPVFILILLTGFYGISSSAIADNTSKYPSSFKTPVLGKTPLPWTYRPDYHSEGGRIFYETLPNGMKILVQERPGCGIVSAEMIIKVGVMQEMDTYGGITGVIQAMMLRGGGKDKFIPLKGKAEADGCFVTGGTSPDFAYIKLISTKDTFRINFKRMLEVIKHPGFKEGILEEEKRKIIQRIEGNKSAYGIINEIFLKQFYRYHPYRQPVAGFKNTVRRLNVEDLRMFYEKFYCSNRMVLSVCGDVKGQDIINLCEKLLSDMPRQNVSVVDIPWEPMRQEKKLHLQASSGMAWIFIGFPAPGVKSPDYPAAKILETLLGEGLSSRLFIELREKEGLAYQLQSKYPELEGPSHMIVYVVTNPKSLYKCRKKIFKEINKLKQWKIGEKELSATKRKVLGKYLLARETTAGQTHYLAYYSALGLGRNFDENLLRRMNRVTVDDVQEVARKYLENYTILIIEPPSQNRVRYRR